MKPQRTLPSYLCSLLNCEITDLPRAVEQERLRVLKLVMSLPLYSGHGTRRAPIKCDGLTHAGPGTFYAYGGQLNVTMEQMFYTQYKVKLQLPSLPCLVSVHEDLAAELYYPIKLAMVDKWALIYNLHSWRVVCLYVRRTFYSVTLSTWSSAVRAVAARRNEFVAS